MPREACCFRTAAGGPRSEEAAAQASSPQLRCPHEVEPLPPMQPGRAHCHCHFQTTAASDPSNLKNAKNAILEELPRIVNTMALLWNVLRREEAQKRPVDLLGATKGSSSVYFKTTKVRVFPVVWCFPLSHIFSPKINAYGNLHVDELNGLDETQQSKSEVEISSLLVTNTFSIHGIEGFMSSFQHLLFTYCLFKF